MKNNLNFFEKLIGSGLYTGYIPFAPGTFGSLLALAIYYLIPGFEKPPVLIFFIITFIFAGIYIGNKFEKIYGKDPSECTIDEFVGMWISLLFVPKNILIIIFVFICWRILDIIKPYPAKEFEELNGGLGIVSDDIVSSVYTLIIIQIFLYLFY